MIDLSFACVNCRDEGINHKKLGCRSLIDANLEGQVGVNKFKLYDNFFRNKRNLSTMADEMLFLHLYFKYFLHYLILYFFNTRC